MEQKNVLTLEFLLWLYIRQLEIFVSCKNHPPQMFYKKAAFKNFAKFTVLRYFQQQVFYRTPPGDCF